MRPVLLIPAVSRPLVYRLRRYESLQLVQFRRAHRVDLFKTNDSIFRQRQPVVLRHRVAVGLSIKIRAQLFRQQIVEKRGLVYALTAYQHHYHVVHHLLVEQRRHHGHEPFSETHVKQALRVFGVIP